MEERVAAANEAAIAHHVKEDAENEKFIVVAHKKFQGTASETMYEMREKRAYAALLSAQAKYDNTK